MAKAMQPQKMRFSQAIQTPMYKNLVNNTLGDPARRFVLLGKHSGKLHCQHHQRRCCQSGLTGMQPGHDFGRCPFG